MGYLRVGFFLQVFNGLVGWVVDLILIVIQLFIYLINEVFIVIWCWNGFYFIFMCKIGFYKVFGCVWGLMNSFLSFDFMQFYLMYFGIL